MMLIDSAETVGNLTAPLSNKLEKLSGVRRGVLYQIHSAMADLLPI